MDLTDKTRFREIDAELNSRIEDANLTSSLDVHDVRYGEPLRYYLLFSHWPELVDDALPPDERFYARYYWFRKFANECQAVRGFDAGLEQQCFQLLEEAGSPVDWTLIEKLDRQARVT
jgi:hypothetical protein